VVGGAFERGRILPSLVFGFFWATIVYCPIACWTWNSNGWLYQVGTLFSQILYLLTSSSSPRSISQEVDQCTSHPAGVHSHMLSFWESANTQVKSRTSSLTTRPSYFGNDFDLVRLVRIQWWQRAQLYR
jgi:hypothetical protein